MKFYKYLKKERLFIEVDFDYAESCRNVYKTFSVFRNGKKSNIRGLKKYLKTDTPHILTANCYFWLPSQNASGRRFNEDRRNTEAYNYFMSEGFTEDSRFYIDAPFTLKRGETYGVDDQGYFFEYRKEQYHFGFKKVFETDLEQARIAIRIRRENNIQNARKQKEFEALKDKVFVTLDDSISAGNCPSGSKDFYKKIPLVKKGIHIRAIRGSALLELKNDSCTIRAVNQAIKRMQEEKNQNLSTYYKNDEAA